VRGLMGTAGQLSTCGGFDVMLVEVGRLVKGPTMFAGQGLRWHRPSGSGQTDVNLPR
jgi:hypothetical protein